MPEYTGKNLNLVKPLLDDYVEQTIPQLAENMQKIDDKITDLAGDGRTTETVKGNADTIAALADALTAHKSETASTTAKGHIQLATAEEAVAGTDTTKAVTPAGVKAALPVSLPANGGNADTVDSHHMNQDVLTTSSPTFANVYAPSFENFKINGSLTNKVVTTDTTQVAQSPIAGCLWHDIFAFNRVSTPTFETSSDGTTWNSATLDKRLFSHKEAQEITVLSSATMKAVRWTWSSGIAWSAISWLVIAYTWVNSYPNVTVNIESSADGVTWTNKHTSTYTIDTKPFWHYVSSVSGDVYLRLTITWNSGGDVKLSSIRGLTARWGEQGLGSEYSYPYDWDENRNIIAPNDVKATTFHKSDGTSVSYEGHTHTKSEITDMPTKLSQFTNDTNYVTQSELGEAGYGNMMKSVYDTDNDGKVDAADSADSVPWSGIKDKPTTFSKTARFVVGTSTAGWTEEDCHYLCDGTNDQAEINAAIQALPANGGEIVILDGTYNITAKIDVNKSNVSIKGNGNATILKRMWESSSIEGVITLTSVEGCRVQNLQIDGNKANYSSASNYGIRLSSSSNNNTVTGNTCNNSNYGIYLSSSSDNTVTGNTCNNNNNGIYLYSSSNNNTVTGNTCNNNSYGIYLALSSNNTVTGNTCNNNSYGIYLGVSSNNTVTGNTCIRGTGQTSDYTSSQYTILLASSFNDYNLISSNNCMGKAVVIEGGTGNSTWGNKFDATNDLP